MPCIFLLGMYLSLILQQRGSFCAPCNMASLFNIFRFTKALERPGSSELAEEITRPHLSLRQIRKRFKKQP